MKVCCIYTQADYVDKDKPIISQAQIPCSLAIISTVLKKCGHDVQVLVMTQESNIEKMMREYHRENHPALFCLTSVTSQFAFVNMIAKKIKTLTEGSFVLLGGHHATLNPEHAITSEWLDAICIGEGENAVVEVARRLETNKPLTGIKNLWLKEPDQIEKNDTMPFIQDLDSIPFIERALWEPWVHDNSRMPSILIGRGCPNKCTYCSNHILANVAEGRYVRFRSPENIIAEIEHIVDENPRINLIYLEAETLGANLKFTYELLEKLRIFNNKRTTNVGFGCNIALNNKVIDNEELLAEMKHANFDFINVGLESGCERIRNEILKRPRYSNDNIVTFCRLARGYGIKVILYVMVGIPGETKRDFLETIECVRKCSPDNVYLSIFYPYPGTELYYYAKKSRFLKEDIPEGRLERRRAVLDMPEFRKKDIQREYILFYYKAFRGIWPLHKIMIYVARTYIGTWYGMERIYRKLVGSRFIRPFQKKFSPGT